MCCACASPRGGWGEADTAELALLTPSALGLSPKPRKMQGHRDAAPGRPGRQVWPVRTPRIPPASTSQPPFGCVPMAPPPAPPPPRGSSACIPAIALGPELGLPPGGQRMLSDQALVGTACSPHCLLGRRQCLGTDSGFLSASWTFSRSACPPRRGCVPAPEWGAGTLGSKDPSTCVTQTQAAERLWSSPVSGWELLAGPLLTCCLIS